MPWPEALEIGDSRIAPGEPITQDLETDYRDRDDRLLDFIEANPGFENWVTEEHLGTTIVGTGELKTATGTSGFLNLLGATAVNIIMNDYAFFPGITGDTGGPVDVVVKTPRDDTPNYGVFRIENPTGPARAIWVYWRYITASDNPLCYVLHDDDGIIQAIWESEDAITGVPLEIEGLNGVAVEFPSIPRIKDLAQNVLQIPPTEALMVMRAHARRLKLNAEHLDDVSGLETRWKQVLKIHFLRKLAERSGDKSSAQMIAKRFKVVDGRLKLKGE